MQCGNCKFWNQGECQRIVDYDEHTPGDPYVTGQGCVHGALITPPDFGCVLFEGKQ